MDFDSSETRPNVPRTAWFVAPALLLALATVAHLQIPTLRAERGPGVELLHYLAPADGRPYRADARPNDLLHWQTTLIAPSLDEAARAAIAAGATVVSRGTADLTSSRLGISRGLLVRDLDGHALLLAEPRPTLARPGSR